MARGNTALESGNGRGEELSENKPLSPHSSPLTPLLGPRLARWWNRVGIWYLFLAPAILLLLIFFAYPLADSLMLSFYKWKGLGARKFVGLDNFEALLDDRFFWGATWHTLVFALVVTLGTVGIGYLLADGNLTPRVRLARLPDRILPAGNALGRRRRGPVGTHL